MKKNRWIALTTISLLASGCADEELTQPAVRADSGTVTPDTFTPPVDTGTPPLVDTGTIDGDVGTTVPDTSGPTPCGEACPNEDVTGDITADTTWSNQKKYTLKKFVRVTAGKTLTIEPGTVILGVKGSAAADITGLAVLPGAKIMAKGSKAYPIVFTSAKAKGSRAPGDWAGIMVLGKAKVNLPAPRYPEGLKDNPEYAYGGDDDADNSGVLSYVRVEFAGYQLSPNNEVNAYTFYGVGSGTQLDHLQAHFGNDDSFEFFGGAVNAKYLIATSGTDDCFDMDNGFRGKLQFLICNRDDISGGGNGFEVDNNATGDGSALPNTEPTIWNATMVGKSTTTTEGGHGMHLRRATKGKWSNILVVGWPLSGIFVDGTATEANATAGALDVKNSLFANTKNYNNAFSDMFAQTAARANKTAAGLDAVLIGSVKSDTPSFALKDGSPALSGAATPSDPFFDASGKDFIGACGKTCPEFEGWTNFSAP